MKRKIILYSWEYFKENHYVDEKLRVWKYKTSRKFSFLDYNIVEKRVYDTRYSFPGPYVIDVSTPSSPWLGEERVHNWMIKEIITEETHPEYFI